MNKQVKIASCLEHIYSISPNTIESSGRYIKAIRQSYGLTNNSSEKVKYEYKLTRSLQKHIMLLQENIVHNSNKTPTNTIDANVAKTIINLTKSQIAYTEGRISYVDVDSLRNLNALEKAVIIKKDIVLPVKVKSSDGVYKFNTQIILSKSNVLSYASNTLDTKEVEAKLYVPRRIEKLGLGIKNNELIENAGSVSDNIELCMQNLKKIVLEIAENY